MNLRTRELFLVGALVALTACGGGAERPVAATQTAVVDGAAIFAQQCSLCHGSDGAGSPAVVAQYPHINLTDARWVSGSRPDQLAHTIRNGVPMTPMQPFGVRLSEAEIEAVARYVLTLKR